MSADAENDKHKQRHGGDANRSGDSDATTPDASVPSQDAGSGKSKGQPASGAAVSGGVLPNKAAEDDPRRWGDQPGSYDHDAWLKEQRPPHWG